ncbi:Dihydropteroate synthase [Chlamydiales bacterium STE3]|nr:Dihydropteroate synthase [Chlamydiales bacterium STE3]
MKTKIMGILNITPDSCYDGGRFFALEKALNRAFSMVEEGADLIDVGGESTRPGASPVPLDEELRRVIPVIKAIREESTIPISIDTMKPEVAEEAIRAGATMINDVTGFDDLKMIDTARKHGVALCVMHMKGNPLTMQNDPHYEEGIIPCLLDWFAKKIDRLISSGIDKNKIILDPGIGFGKTVVDNVKILQNVPKLQKLGFPLLLGASRKSFLTKICNKERDQLLAASLAAHMTGAIAEVDYIRVHDVREHRDMLSFLSLYKEGI